jgi:flagellar hook-associated protein 2
MQGLTSISGLISGLKTDDIIAKIIEAGKQPIERYQARQANLRDQQAALQEANTRLGAVKDAAGQLALSSFFDSQSVTSSNTSVLSATAGTGAAVGQYTMTVQSLALAHQQVSQSYSDVDTTTLGTGTLTIAASGQTTTLNVDSSNNTLAGIRDAINRSNSNVGASIVQDGDSSYRLMLYSKQTGTANALTIQSTLNGGTAPTLTDLQAAQDAKVQLGTGAHAITTVRSTNTVTDLIPGVTLNLASEAPNSPVTIAVTQDTSRIKDAVQKLVDQYNNAIDYINQQSKFDPDTKKGGLLLSDYTLQGVQTDLQAVFTQSVKGISGVTLAGIGVTMGNDGKLSLDADKLQSKLETDPEGLKQVLALSAKTTNTGVRLVSAGSKPIVDGSSYAVEITQAATQGRVTAGTTQTGALDADETLTINGIAVGLTAGMSQADVVAAINARAKDTGVTVSATAAGGTGSGNFMTFRNTAYGSAASLSVISSLSSASGVTSGVGDVTATAVSPAGETGSGTGALGRDVEGTINGEAATGTGQILTGSAGNEATDGLKLRITAATPGSLGTIQLFDGIASMAQRTITRITGSTGAIQGQEDGLDQRIQDLQDVIDSRADALQRQEDSLRAKFNRLEMSLAQLQSQSTQLSQQLGSLQK